MKRFIVAAQYRVEVEDFIEMEDMEKVEAQRWQMFQEKYSVDLLELKVEKLD